MDALQSASLSAIPIGHRREVHRLAWRAGGHPERTTADQGRGVVEPGILSRRGDHVAVHHPERPERDLRQEVARRSEQRDLERLRIGHAEARHGCRPSGRDGRVPGDEGEQGRVVALASGGAIPAVLDVGRRERIAVGETRCCADLKGVLEAVRGDGGLAIGEIGHFFKVVVEAIEARDDVA